MFTGLAAGLVSLSVPLLRDLHWESAGAASLIIALYSGWLAAGPHLNYRYRAVKILGLLIGWSTPLFVFALFTGCFSFDGLAFWFFGPIPSALFGWAAGRAVSTYVPLHSRLWTMILLSTMAVLPLLIQFLTYPQLYFFNHIWSYWPGPIYDEIVFFDSRLVGFRFLTLLWVVVLWALPTAFRQKLSTLIVLLGTIAILFAYSHAAEWGWITPEERIQQHLGGLHETTHFRIYYPPDSLTPEQLNDLEGRHETYLAEITERLEIDRTIYRDQKIHSYIYIGADQKKLLTGAGQTSFVPVWLKQDQLHINFSALEPVLKHELVHIVTKQFSNWFGASNSIGLVEGVAVALAPNRYPARINQLVAARPEWPGPEEIQTLFSFSGFYRSSGPVSYLVSGSFVQHLLENYPVDSFKAAFRSGDLETSYAPLTAEDLVESWHRILEGTEVDDEARSHSLALFQRPSIFQIPCPRVEKQRELRRETVIAEEVSPACLEQTASNN